MREREQYAIAAAARKRELLVLRQLQFVQLRHEAIERAECYSTPWTRLKWLVNPAAKYAVVDAIQKALMDKENAEAMAQAAKPKIQVVGAL